MSNKIIGSDPTQVSIDISKTRALVCKCGNHTFTQISFLRVLPALLSPNGKDAVIPMMSFACNACGAVPDQVIPPFVRDEAVRLGSDIAPDPNVSDEPTSKRSKLTLINGEPS
jgi:hypothetical protein